METAALLDVGGRSTERLEGASDHAFILVEGSGASRVALRVEPTDGGVRERWNVVQVSAGIEQPLAVTDTANPYWRPLQDCSRAGRVLHSLPVRSPDEREVGDRNRAPSPAVLR